jgi:single-strand DNA-binding protein
MANLNRVMLIGRLTRDPEIRVFSNGGKVAQFGFAVNNRKKDPQSGQWVDDPCFLDVKAFNRETGRKMADLVEQYLAKGRQVFIEGHLVMESWTSQQDGQKRNKLVIVVDDLQFLEPRQEGGGGGAPMGAGAPAARSGPAPMQQKKAVAPPMDDGFDSEPPSLSERSPHDDDIPF